MSTEPMTTQPYLSPDRRWRWDGARWVPYVDPREAAKQRRITGIVLACVFAPVLLVIAAAVLGGEPEPSVYEKTEAMWATLTPTQQDAVCTSWAVAPNTTAAELAKALGYPGEGRALAEQMLNQVC